MLLPLLVGLLISAVSSRAAPVSGAANAVWTIGEFPNPKIQFAECGMRSYARLCDPDQILTESDRYRLNSGLTNMQSRSEGSVGDFCAKKGVEGVMAVVDNADQTFADGLYQKWAGIDAQCKKAIVVVLSKSTHRIFIAGAAEAHLDAIQVAGIIADQEQELREGRYVHALEGVLQRIGRLAKPAETNQMPANQPPRQPAAGFGRGAGASAFSLQGVALVSLLLAFLNAQ